MQNIKSTQNVFTFARYYSVTPLSFRWWTRTNLSSYV